MYSIASNATETKTWLDPMCTMAESFQRYRHSPQLLKFSVVSISLMIRAAPPAEYIARELCLVVYRFGYSKLEHMIEMLISQILLNWWKRKFWNILDSWWRLLFFPIVTIEPRNQSSCLETNAATLSYLDQIARLTSNEGLALDAIETVRNDAKFHIRIFHLIEHLEQYCHVLTRCFLHGSFYQFHPN